MTREIVFIREKITIPTTPNYILKNGVSTDIGYFTKTALKAIGREWIKDLIAKADKRFNQLGDF